MVQTIYYPIGIQSFKEMREGGYAYVDKTAYVEKLIASRGKYYFLSRPRRFGKSLFLSTLRFYFEGRRDLFKGLYLDSADMDWTPSPVLYIDFNTGIYDNPDGLEICLNLILRDYEQAYGIAKDAIGVDVAGRFKLLIQAAYRQTGRKVAILIDEYDKSLLGLEEDSETFRHNQNIIRGFFSNLKTMDEYIRFAMITGVARVHKVSIFSGFNNPEDISLDKDYADICGWTEEELLNNYRPGIEALAEERGEDFGSTVDSLREYYDGYLFHEKGHKLYNPFSVLRALKAKYIEPYWFATATPTFLANLVKKNGISLPDLQNNRYKRSQLLAVGFDTISLMFQTGYLTIDSYDHLWGYKLRFPNSEVEIGFAECLYPLYVPAVSDGSSFALDNFNRDLCGGNPQAFMERLQTLIKCQPYHLQNEGNFQNIVWNICTLCGTDAQAERHSYKGRSDLEVTTPNHIYVFEFKYNQSAEAAMSQLRGRDYAGRFALEPRPVCLIGANLSAEAELTWIIDKSDQ